MKQYDGWVTNDGGYDDRMLDVGEEIFQYIRDNVATYPQEIAGELGHSLNTVQHHLRRMFNDQRIGKIATPYDRCPDRIAYRLEGLQAEGMSGTDIRKKTWYCIMESGVQLRERLRAEGKLPNKYDTERIKLFLHNAR